MHKQHVFYLVKSVGLGALIGCIFPIVAWVDRHDVETLFYYICSAPFIVGVFAYYLSNADLRKQLTERSLEEWEKRSGFMAQIINAVPAMMFVKDLEGKYVVCNSLHAELIGMSPDQVIGKTLDDMFPPDITRVLKENDRRVVASRSFQSIEEQIPINGQMAWVISTLFPICDAHGDVTHVGGMILDVTAKKILQQQLIEAQSISKIGSWRYDFADNNLVWSTEHYKIFEIEEPQPSVRLYKLYRERIYSDDLPALDRLVERAAKFGEDFTFDHRVVLDGGERIKFVRGVGKVICDEAGRPVAVSGTCHDRTADVETENQFQAVFESLSEGLIVQDADGRIVQANPAAERLLQVGPLVGRQSWEVKRGAIHEDGTPFSIDEHPSSIARKTGKIVPGVVMGFRSKEDGTVRWLRVNAAPTLHANGRRAVVSLTDITPILAAQQENLQMTNRLYQSERRLQYALDAIGEGVWDWNVSEGSVNHNLRWCELLGLDDGFLQHSLEDFASRLHVDDKPAVMEKLDVALSGRGDYESEHRMLKKDGKTIWVHDRGRVVERDESGKPLRMVGSVKDITQMRETQLNLIQSSKLASLGEMSAGIAHEINNPLAIIEGTATLLLRDFSGDEKLKAKLVRIEKATWRIAKIVTGLRKFARASTEEPRQPQSLKQILAESLLLTEAQFKRNNVSLQINCETTAQILCHEIEIEQVFVILFNNSIDAIKSFEQRWVSLQVEERDSDLVVRLRDAGKGIPANVAEKIFQPFFTTKTVGEGTGLGLSIAKGILDVHGATIKLMSEDPHTCFEITFPKYIEKKNAA